MKLAEIEVAVSTLPISVLTSINLYKAMIVWKYSSLESFILSLVVGMTCWIIGWLITKSLGIALSELYDDQDIPKSTNKRVSISPSLYRSVYSRDGKRCRYCGTTNPPFEIDHVYPVSQGGKTVLDNLVVSCKTCNRSKKAKLGIFPKNIGESS